MAIYYVSTAGNNGNAGSLASPWATIAYAVGGSSPVAAGDTVYVRSNGGNYTQYVQVGVGGANGNPITIETYPADMPTKAHLTTGGSLGAIYNPGPYGNLTWKNLEVSGTVGGAGFYMDDGGSNSGQTTTIDGCHIHDNNSGDNASGIFLQRVRGTWIIQNNVIHDNVITPGGVSPQNNATALVIFSYINSVGGGATTLRFLHNEVYNQAVGFKVKHPFPADMAVIVEVAYNYVHNIYGRAGLELSASDSGQGSAGHSKRVHHNLCINSNSGTGPGIKLSADFGEWDTEVDHNTCYNVGHGIQLHYEDGANSAQRDLIHNNILYPEPISGSAIGAAIFLEATGTPYSTFDYNCYYTNNGSVNWTSGYQSFAAWRAATNGPDAHSLNTNPLFVNTSSDFHLQSGSPCRNTDSGGHDMGCYELRTEVMGPIASGGGGGVSAALASAQTCRATIVATMAGSAAALTAAVSCVSTNAAALYSISGGLSDYLENHLIDHILRNRAWARPVGLYVALFTVPPTDAGGGTEVSGGSYARILVAPSDTNWQSTQGTTSAVASSGTAGRTANGNSVVFASPTGNWGSITHFAIFDALTGGNLLGYGPLNQIKAVNNGDPAPNFPPAALTVTFA